MDTTYRTVTERKRKGDQYIKEEFRCNMQDMREIEVSDSEDFSRGYEMIKLIRTIYKTITKQESLKQEPCACLRRL